jgi:hypothetical protein
MSNVVIAAELSRSFGLCIWAAGSFAGASVMIAHSLGFESVMVTLDLVTLCAKPNKHVLQTSSLVLKTSSSVCADLTGGRHIGQYVHIVAVDTYGTLIFPYVPSSPRQRTLPKAAIF